MPSGLPLTDALLPLLGSIRHAHIALVLASGALFAARGAAAIAGRSWPRRRGWRVASQSIDTLLLAAGATLWTLLGLNPLRGDAWLGTKLLLLVAYIALGTLAMRDGRSRIARIGFYVAALAVFGFMLSVARAHSPWGVFGAFVSGF